MRVVVDANIVAAAALRPDGWTSLQLRRDDIEAFAPVGILDELAAHEAELAPRAELALADWRMRVLGVARRIRKVPTAALARHASHPLFVAMQRRDPDDAQYVAAFLEAKADFLWTRDRAICDVLPGRAGPVVPAEAPRT